jgi:hypothetical protein
MKTNALEELKNSLGSLDKILCADICHYRNNGTYKEIKLKTGENRCIFEKELSKINYDAGYGLRYIYGRVWTTNFLCLDRYEYNGAEQWIFAQFYPVPDHLVTKPWTIIRYFGHDYLVNVDDCVIVPMFVHNLTSILDRDHIDAILKLA